MKRLGFVIVGDGCAGACGVQQQQQDAVQNAELNQPAADQLNELANQAAMDAANARSRGAANQQKRLNEQNAAADNTVNPTRSRRAKRQRHVSGRGR